MSKNPQWKLNLQQASPASLKFSNFKFPPSFLLLSCPATPPRVHAKLRSRQLTWMHIAYKLLYLPYRLMELTSLTGHRFTHVHAKCKSQMRRFYKYMNILHKYIYRINIYTGTRSYNICKLTQTWIHLEFAFVFGFKWKFFRALNSLEGSERKTHTVN